MKGPNRREFLGAVGLGVTGLGVGVSGLAQLATTRSELEQTAEPPTQSQPAAIDFRYAPPCWQTAYCFPDDPYKSLIGERGELRYGNPGRGKGINYFPLIVEFSLAGTEGDRVGRQQLEAPSVPIVHTRIDRPEALLELTTFATNHAAEGRVDNVIAEIRPRTRKSVDAVLRVTVKTRHELRVEASAGGSVASLDGGSEPLFLAADTPLSIASDSGLGYVLASPAGPAAGDKPLRYFLRFPQEGQNLDKIQAGLQQPDRLLAETRRYWRNWRPFGGDVAWSLAGPHHDFLLACARNIAQAREVRDGKLTFQVGPTVYRGLWVVDGNFLLETARYLGADSEAQQGLEATWAKQQQDGSVVAAVGKEHWKDTGIALFTLVRQAELSQDWSYFRGMQPQVLRAVRFLMSLPQKAKNEGSANGRYGLLPMGFGDGGLAGIRSEFTNTLWALAGLKAVTEAAAQLGLPGFDSAEQFYQQLRDAFSAAARQEMKRHPAGFDYLPMLMKEDSLWESDPWLQPRPQTAQWALSHAIYPGLVFDKSDPIVTGHIALMQTCTQEDVPAETGWLPHEGLWTYNAAFVAEVYLWAGLPGWARRTFAGFLNHATPLYCWREEQALKGSLVSRYVGDMPHNWASAECVRFLRHMLALEDGSALRLLAGVGEYELRGGHPFGLAGSPTRFGRVSLHLEPLDAGRGWRLAFQRQTGAAPGSVTLPASLGPRFRFAELAGAEFTTQENSIRVDPEKKTWAAIWRA